MNALVSPALRITVALAGLLAIRGGWPAWRRGWCGRLAHPLAPTGNLPFLSAPIGLVLLGVAVLGGTDFDEQSGWATAVALVCLGPLVAVIPLVAYGRFWPERMPVTPENRARTGRAGILDVVRPKPSPSSVEVAELIGEGTSRLGRWSVACQQVDVPPLIPPFAWRGCFLYLFEHAVVLAQNGAEDRVRPDRFVLVVRPGDVKRAAYTPQRGWRIFTATSEYFPRVRLETASSLVEVALPRPLFGAPEWDLRLLERVLRTPLAS